MVQELIWKNRPDVIVESGVAHGGALVLYASLLELLGRGRVIGIDIEIRKYNRLAIESHPASRRIALIEGSSTDTSTVGAVRSRIQPGESVMVMLDSNHTRDHVRAELELYAPLVGPGGYVVVFDEVMPMVADAPNGKPSWDLDNPLEAVRDFLATPSGLRGGPQLRAPRGYLLPERLSPTDGTDPVGPLRTAGALGRP